ncbi:TonB-dependent receptor plug domain-containing protein [Undibacterium sp. Ji67W]|uniref:TonB-dependent receptor plug domain-containing protein n=1 Tax=Undibacterium sp. Ji67W TaxID=3413042 RepID=UPI003BF293F5
MKKNLSLYALQQVFAASCILAFPVVAVAEADQIQRVELNGVNATNKVRQGEPTIVSVFGKEELARYGDTVLSEVLKRLPGVTISESKNKGTVISLRGLGVGYTQILLNGEIMPDGFAIDTIAPENIERIEIMRVAGADSSAQGIAGSINVILKKKTTQDQTEVKWRLNQQLGYVDPGLTFSSSGKSGDLAYNLSAVLDRSRTDNNDRIDEYLLQKAAPDSRQAETLLSARQLQQAAQVQRDSLSITPHLNWQINPDQTLSWQGFVNQVYLHQTKQESETTLAGPTTDFPHNTSVWNGHLSTARNTFSWERSLENDAKLSLTTGWNYFRRASFFQFWGSDVGGQLLQHRDVSADANENVFKLNGKYLVPAIKDHALSMGWETSYGKRQEQRTEHDQDAGGNQVLYTNQQYDASMTKLALFAQDEWHLSESWLSYLGLRWEHVSVQSDVAGGFALAHTDSLLSPIVQTVWKLDAQRQWRFALNRTLKAPTLVNLIPRIIRIDNDNGPLNPDQQGNPVLRAEKSWGLDVAYEQFNAEGSMLSASSYMRKISDVTIDSLSQQANGWLVMPVNNGNAVVLGIELETKFALTAIDASLPKINLHANLNRNWSRVMNVPGPDNVMPDQVKFSANVGMDYQLQAGWTLGGNYSFQSHGAERASAYSYASQNPQRKLDMYSVWKVNPQTQIRLSVSNLLHQDSRQRDDYEDTQIRAGQQIVKARNAVWHLLWEQRF